MRTYSATFYAVDISALMTITAWLHDAIPSSATLVVIVPTVYYTMLIAERILTYIRVLRDKLGKDEP